MQFLRAKLAEFDIPRNAFSYLARARSISKIRENGLMDRQVGL